MKFFLGAATVIIAITAWQVWHAGMYNGTDSLVHAFFLASSMMTDNVFRRPITLTGLPTPFSCC